jgi:REP element-mobilizing transposase RayT
MARPRIVDPTGVYHVGSKGNYGGILYRDPNDRTFFIDLYARVAKKQKWKTYAYCLMTNHFHFVIGLEDGGLSEGMRELNGCFSRRMNAIMDRTGQGHLVKNRFYAETIDSDAYMVGACRYVVLNPVRAGIVERPEAWGWSSYSATAGLCPAPAFLAVDELLGFFSPMPDRARAAYCAFVASGHDPWSDQRKEGVRDRRRDARMLESPA